MQYTFGAPAIVAAALFILPAASSPPLPAASAVVHIRDFTFVPSTLSIAAGQTVRFVNDDGEAHTVTARDATFDSAGLDTHAVWDHAFMKPGTYAYLCQLHPMMTATIVVRAAGQRS